ncbi:sodium:solute symporter family protein [Mesobacillus harenae]|uniref:sodium:solute symporter family protein n=1 Tax=Mesobacillus harenae TaxID=2213203 RepID=UPI0015801A31|nr:sodium:solute symporter family protein [Mesobacillus harenae]
MKTLQLSIVLIYLVFCVLLGLWTQRKIANSKAGIDDYYAAGRNIGTGINSLALLAALGSGGSFMAGAGTIWNLGFPFLAWMTVGAIAGFSVAAILVAKPLRNSNTLTVSQFLNERYGGNKFIKLAVPLVIIFGSGMYLMSQMKAGGLITSYVTGFSYTWGLIIVTIIFILYVSLGGMLAVTWTNVLQGGLMILLISAIVIAALMNLPTGLGSFLVQATEANPILGVAGGTVPIAGYIGAFVTWAAAVCVTPHLVMRIFTSKDEKSARLSLNISMLIYGILMLVSALIIVPFIATLGADTLKNNASDMWMLLVAEKFFGPLMMGIIAAGIMAAVMSSTDALLLAVSSAVAYDLYKGVLKPEATQKQVLRVSFVVTWIIGIVVMLFSINPPPFLIVLYTAAVGFMVASFFNPLVLGIWWKKANAAGAVAGLSVGAISFLIAFFAFEMPYNTEILIALPLSFISMFTVSSITASTSKIQVEKMSSYHSN